MNDPTSDELLSAYLDGELTAEEQAQIERQLADSAELRQLLDDLRALRGGLESLPQYRLDDDFAARVLRRAEQAMLTPAATDSGQLVAAAAPQRDDAQPAVAGDSPHRFRGIRTWGWAAAAIAAGLVIMVFEQRPAVERPPAAAPGPTTPPDAAWIAVDQPHGAVGDVATKAGPAEGGLGGKSELGAAAAKTDALGDSTTTGVLAGSSATSANTAANAAAAPPLNAIAADEKKAAEPRTEGVSGSMDRFGDGDTLVVNCTVTREALEQRQFDRLLNERQIVMDDAETGKDGVPPKDASQFAGQSSSTGGAMPTAPLRQAAEAMKQSNLADDQGKNKATDAEVDAVVVDTTAGQISAVLADLNQNPKWFPSVQVDPAPQAAAQQSLTIYNRGEGQPSVKNDLGVARDKIVEAEKKSPGAAQMNVQSPDVRSMAKSAAPQTQVPVAENLNANRGNLQQQGRAQRLAKPKEWQAYPPLGAESRRNQDPFESPAQNAAPAEAVRNLGQSLADGREKDAAQQQFKARGDLSGQERKLANEEAAPVRALFLLRVVDTPTVPVAPAAPASQEPMTK